MKYRYLMTLTAAASMMLAGCTSTDVDPSADSSAQWYRGNTHTHTVICGHADSKPEVVANWYLERGYNFLILSEHNHFIDPATVKLPEDRRKDFILVPGVELTGSKAVHTTSMNVSSAPPWKFNAPEKSAIIQNHVDETRKAGGHAILNHPNFHYAVSGLDISKVNGLHMFELFNGHPHVHSHGDHKHASTEVMWDEVLTKGMEIYGVSSDDAHHFQTIAPNKSNPGRGWVMVAADKLESTSITEAMRRGDFYASNGVFLNRCKRGTRYLIDVAPERTVKELVDNPLLRGKSIDAGEEGYRIEFIGQGGKVLKTVKGVTASFDVKDAKGYVRAKVTLTRKHPTSGNLEEYYAWGQPVFTDARQKQ